MYAKPLLNHGTLRLFKILLLSFRAAETLNLTAL